MRHSSPRFVVALAAVFAIALVSVQAPAASNRLQVRIFDEEQTLFGNPDETFPVLAELGVEVLRVNLYWNRVAPLQPSQPGNPADINYDWDLYDRTALFAQQFGIDLMFSIYATPGWANVAKGANFAPKQMTQLQAFARAAALRYSGVYLRQDGVTLPAVTKWMAWNEPNQPTFLKPQWRKRGKKFVPASPRIYAKICNSIRRGVKSAGKAVGVSETVACGATSPRGNNIGNAKRSSVSPRLFLREMKNAGAKFDVYAHHPYAGSRFESPSTKPKARTAVTLGNIGTLFEDLNRYYGKKMRLWVTEYGYQTNPPDGLFGVSWKKQDRYLRDAHKKMKKNPRIDLMLWFLLRDEQEVGRWQSGLMTVDGQLKPAFNAFKKLPR